MWNREDYTQMKSQLAAPVGLECSLQIIKIYPKNWRASEHALMHVLKG